VRRDARAHRIPLNHSGSNPKRQAEASRVRAGSEERAVRWSARDSAITSGGAIPDNSLYTVVAEPEGAVVGTVGEDFAAISSRFVTFRDGAALEAAQPLTELGAG
jgi:Lhr-like helicase